MKKYYLTYYFCTHFFVFLSRLEPFGHLGSLVDAECFLVGDGSGEALADVARQLFVFLFHLEPFGHRWRLV